MNEISWAVDISITVLTRRGAADARAEAAHITDGAVGLVADPGTTVIARAGEPRGLTDQERGLYDPLSALSDHFPRLRGQTNVWWAGGSGEGPNAGRNGLYIDTVGDGAYLYVSDRYDDRAMAMALVARGTALAIIRAVYAVRPILEENRARFLTMPMEEVAEELASAVREAAPAGHVGDDEDIPF